MAQEKPPLQLSYEPDDYLCSWNIPDGAEGVLELPGSLEVRPGRPPRGTIYGSLPVIVRRAESGVAMSFPQTTEMPVLTGTLANGGSVLLLDASLSYWSAAQGHVSGSAALLGRGDAFAGWTKAKGSVSSAPPLIRSVEFQLTGLDALVGSAPIASVQNPAIHPDNPKDIWSATLNLDARANWKTKGAELSIDYSGRMRAADAYEFRLAFSPKGTFAFANGISLRQVIDEFVQPLRAIASIATGEAQDLTYLAVTLEGESAIRQVYGVGITQAPFKSSVEGIKDADSVLRAKEDGISLLDLVNAWHALTVDHHPLIETYGAMLHASDQHPRSRFLLLIQALEGLHGYQTATEFQKREAKHLSQRATVLHLVENSLSPKLRRFLKNSLTKRPLTSLETALKALIESLPVNVMDRLSATAIVTEAKAGEGNPETSASALRVVRNNLAHGKRGYDTDALDEVVRILELVVRAHALKVLGSPDSIVARVLVK